jgi:putative mRNA 3-end processing factor
MSRPALLELTDRGLYCPPGDFHIDPWRPVDRAVVTHAHADHLRWGSNSYLVSEPGERVTRVRLGPDATIQTAPYGQPVTINGVRVSLHPAGHILGSAQVRVEHRGEVWVVSGDYKTGGGDTTCEAFEPVRCHGFVSESTFGLPIYRWPDPDALAADINAWWRSNAAAGKCSLVYGYSLGKAQRILALLDPSVGPIYTHGAVARLTEAYRDTGVPLPPTEYAGVTDASGKRVKKQWAGAIVVAPPSAHGSPWVKKFAPASAAVCSGWMTVRGTRRRKAVDRGFPVSDHADWPGLLDAIAATGAEKVWVTHGYTAVLVRYLRDRGVDASVVQTRFEGEGGGEDEAADPAAGAPQEAES